MVGFFMPESPILLNPNFAVGHSQQQKGANHLQAWFTVASCLATANSRFR